MPLDPEFLEDCPYLPSGLFIDEILEVNREDSLVRVRMPTHADLPLTNTQRAHPQRHPRHVSGGLIVHMTGIAGFVHAYYVLDLRHADGWVGYGSRIQKARFKNMAHMGEPLIIECKATQVRLGKKNMVARYHYEMTQDAQLIYEADHTGMFVRVQDAENEEPRTEN